MSGTTPATSARFNDMGNGIISEMIADQVQFFYDPTTGSARATYNGLPYILINGVYHSLNVTFDCLQVDLDSEMTRCYGLEQGGAVVDPVTGVDLTKISVAGIMTLIKIAYDSEYNTRAAAMPPVAAYSVAVNGLNVTFTDKSTPAFGNTLTAWAWDFGDGNTVAIPAVPDSTSNIQNPTFTYTKAGTYTVTLDITASNGKTATVMHVVTVA